MAIINNNVDIGDLMMMIDENYDDRYNEYDYRVLENTDVEIDDEVVDYEYDDGGDDYLDIADYVAAELAKARGEAIETEIDDDVMDMVIDDEVDEMDEDELEDCGCDDATLESYVEAFNEYFYI